MKIDSSDCDCGVGDGDGVNWSQLITDIRTLLCMVLGWGMDGCSVNLFATDFFFFFSNFSIPCI